MKVYFDFFYVHCFLLVVFCIGCGSGDSNTVEDNFSSISVGANPVVSDCVLRDKPPAAGVENLPSLVELVEEPPALAIQFHRHAGKARSTLGDPSADAVLVGSACDLDLVVLVGAGQGAERH